MEVEEETDCKKKLDEQKKSPQRQLRDTEKFMDMDPIEEENSFGAEVSRCHVGRIQNQHIVFLKEGGSAIKVIETKSGRRAMDRESDQRHRGSARHAQPEG